MKNQTPPAPTETGNRLGSTAKLGSFALNHSTDGLIARLNAMADVEDDDWAADVLRQLANKLRDTREVLIRVSKEADFSQCPGLEDAVDFVLRGLPNVKVCDAPATPANQNPCEKPASNRVRSIGS